MSKYTLLVNGSPRQVEADDDTPLLWVLRDQLNLKGTKYSCGVAQCGACTVHLNGTAVKSCVTSLGMAQNAEITTIEGLSEDGSHPVQQAWKELDVPQCGYCQAGQIMTAVALLDENKAPTRQDVRAAMNGNICRCASYNRIEDAVLKAANKK
jgi:isoquinoline 1-oxidoreductase alpha subunit